MNVSRVCRLLKLITTLKSGRRFDADGLAGEMSVSRRTLFRDLGLLQEAGIPYRFIHDQQRYAIADSFFLPPIHLDLEESLALLLVTRKFLARQVHPHYQFALDAALKIESNLPAAVRRQCGRYLDGVSIRWEPMTSADGIRGVFDLLQRAIGERQELSGRYESASDQTELDVVLAPWRLVFISRGWYLIAKSMRHDEVRTFKVDRFTSLARTGKVCDAAPEDFDADQHFGAAWRMIPDGALHDIKLRFSEKVAQNVEDVQWHASQQTRRLPDGRLLFEARVDGLREIIWWILGYGDEVEVIAPDSLRSELRRRAERMVALATGPVSEGDN